MKQAKDPGWLRESPWEGWPAEWHARFAVLAGEAQAYATELSKTEPGKLSADSIR